MDKPVGQLAAALLAAIVVAIYSGATSIISPTDVLDASPHDVVRLCMPPPGQDETPEETSAQVAQDLVTENDIDEGVKQLAPLYVHFEVPQHAYALRDALKSYLHASRKVVPDMRGSHPTKELLNMCAAVAALGRSPPKALRWPLVKRLSKAGEVLPGTTCVACANCGMVLVTPGKTGYKDPNDPFDRATKRHFDVTAGEKQEQCSLPDIFTFKMPLQQADLFRKFLRADNQTTLTRLAQVNALGKGSTRRCAEPSDFELLRDPKDIIMHLLNLDTTTAKAQRHICVAYCPDTYRILYISNSTDEWRAASADITGSTVKGIVQYHISSNVELRYKLIVVDKLYAPYLRRDHLLQLPSLNVADDKLKLTITIPSTASSSGALQGPAVTAALAVTDRPAELLQPCDAARAEIQPAIGTSTLSASGQTKSTSATESPARKTSRRVASALPRSRKNPIKRRSSGGPAAGRGETPQPTAAPRAMSSTSAAQNRSLSVSSQGSKPKNPKPSRKNRTKAAAGDSNGSLPRVTTRAEWRLQTTAGQRGSANASAAAGTAAAQKRSVSEPVVSSRRRQGSKQKKSKGPGNNAEVARTLKGGPFQVPVGTDQKLLPSQPQTSPFGTTVFPSGLTPRAEHQNSAAFRTAVQSSGPTTRAVWTQQIQQTNLSQSGPTTSRNSSRTALPPQTST